MGVIDAVLDHCIRRGLAFVGLAIGITMLALSFDAALALRVGADMMALTAAVLLWGAWRAPRRDHRRSEAWTELTALSPDLASRLRRGDAQRLLADSARRRLVWHAERIAVGAVAFWGVSALILFARDA